MVTLGGVIGAVFANVLLFVSTEWVVADTPHDALFDAVLVAVATVVGWSAGTRLARAYVNRRSI